MQLSCNARACQRFNADATAGVAFASQKLEQEKALGSRGEKHMLLCAPNSSDMAHPFRQYKSQSAMQRRAPQATVLRDAWLPAIGDERAQRAHNAHADLPTALSVSPPCRGCAAASVLAAAP